MLLLKETAMNSRHQEQVDAAVQVSKHIAFGPTGAEIRLWLHVLVFSSLPGIAASRGHP